MPRKTFDALVEQAAATANPVQRRRLIARAKTKATPQAGKKLGRPTRFDSAMADKLLDGIAQGKTLPKLCAELAIGIESFYDWLEADKAFSESYRFARQRQAITLVDTLIEESERAADNPVALKIRADILRWVAARYNPERFSDVRKLELSGEVQHRVVHELTPEQRERIAASWLISRGADTQGITATTSGPALPDLDDGVNATEPEREIPPRRKASAKSARKSDEDDGWR